MRRYIVFMGDMLILHVFAVRSEYFGVEIETDTRNYPVPVRSLGAHPQQATPLKRCVCYGVAPL